MKRIAFSLIIALSTFLGIHAQDCGFVHPGGLHSQADFDTIRAQVAAKQVTVLRAYNALVSWAANGDQGPGVQEVITRGSTNDSGNAAYRVRLAYKWALLWQLTGKKKYGDIAVKILNAWAAGCKRVTGDTNAALCIGLQGYQFAQVGEMMRTYEGWKAEDFKKYQEWMLSVWYPQATKFLLIRNGCNPGGYWSNWGLCNALCMMSIGILCDDLYIYNTGLSYYKYDMAYQDNKMNSQFRLPWRDYSEEPYSSYPVIYETSSGSGVYRENGFSEYLGNLVAKLHPDSRGVDIRHDGNPVLGQMQEFGRDQGHCTMSIGLAADICATAWSQGDDLWGWMDNRLAAGIEEVALYNSMTSVNDCPFTPYHYNLNNLSNNHSEYTINNIGSSARGQERPYWERILGHYRGVKGFDMTYSQKMAQKYSSSSLDEMSGVDHLGLTKLTCVRQPISADRIPVQLRPYITQQGTRSKRTSLIGLTAGSSVTLELEIPDSVQGGTWSWDCGNDSLCSVSTTGTLVVSPTRSNIYRGTYISANGVKSTQMFSIQVYGDCHGDPIERHFYVSNADNAALNGWYESDVIPCYEGSTTTLSCQAGNNEGNSTYYVRNEAGEMKVISSPFTIEQDTTIILCYRNLGGGESWDSVRFEVTIEPITMQYSINGGSNQTGTDLTIDAGGKIQFKPSHSQAKSWLWSTGSKARLLTIRDIQQSADYTVTVTTTKGRQLADTFHVTCIGGTDAVNIIEEDAPTAPHSIYDLQGRHVSGITRHGIYIVGGRKVVK